MDAEAGRYYVEHVDFEVGEVTVKYLPTDKRTPFVHFTVQVELSEDGPGESGASASVASAECCAALCLGDYWLYVYRPAWVPCDATGALLAVVVPACVAAPR